MTYPSVAQCPSVFTPGLRSLLALAFSALAAACSTADDSPLTREEFCRRWAGAACQDEVVSVCQASSKQACQDAQTSACLEWLPDVIHDTNTKACIDAVASAYSDADLRASELDVVLRLGGACSQIAPTTAGGTACSNDADCDTGSGRRCVFKNEPEGRCEVPEMVKPGFSCSEPQQACEPGFFCNGDNCIAALGSGVDCVNNSQCDADSYCDGSCESRHAVGAACINDYECASDLCYTVGNTPTCTDRIRLSPAEPFCADLR